MNDYIFTLGTTVHCDDKACGKLSKIVIDPKNWQVNDLVVEEGLLLKRARVFPRQLVIKATHEEIFLLETEENLANYPEYRESVIERAVDENFEATEIIQGSPYGLSTSSPPVPMIRETITEGVAEHLTILNTNTTIKATDTAVGSLRGVAAIQANGLITHLLVHKGTIFTEEFWIPTSKVDHFGDNHITLEISRDEVEELVERQKEDLDEADEHHFIEETYDAKPEANNHTNGHSQTAVPTNDAALAAAISERLMNDDRTADCVIEVIPERGQITLTGTVDSPQTKMAAEQIVTNSPGVVTVSNQLKVQQPERI